MDMKSLSWNEIKLNARRFQESVPNAPSISPPTISLYDPNTTPLELRKAHDKLEKAVDALYGKGKKSDFENERQRMEYLFDLYDQYANPLIQ